MSRNSFLDLGIRSTHNRARSSERRESPVSHHQLNPLRSVLSGRKKEDYSIPHPFPTLQAQKKNLGDIREYEHHRNDPGRPQEKKEIPLAKGTHANCQVSKENSLVCR